MGPANSRIITSSPQRSGRYSSYEQIGGGPSWPHSKEAQRRRTTCSSTYLEMGEGPLALCLHGFPDSPFSYRHLLPELAAAGYRAVAPFMCAVGGVTVRVYTPQPGADVPTEYDTGTAT